jgi:hypothetical protein
VTKQFGSYPPHPPHHTFGILAHARINAEAEATGWRLSLINRKLNSDLFRLLNFENRPNGSKVIVFFMFNMLSVNLEQFYLLVNGLKKQKFNCKPVKITMLCFENCKITIYACWRLYSEKITCGGNLPHS